MKVKLFSFLLTGTIFLINPLNAQDNSTCDASTIATIENNNLAEMQTLTEESKNLLNISINILNISTQLVKEGENVNTNYVNAMLRLSDDIGKMADRIGEMADRILFTEEQIGIMSDRILETQRIQSNNLALTEANLLQAQKNFNNLLISLAQSH